MEFVATATELAMKGFLLTGVFILAVAIGTIVSALIYPL